MKVFLDTNIFLEYLEQRRSYEAVGKIFDAIEDGRIKAIVSIGCVYTLAYLIRMELKRKGVHRPEQTKQLRSVLSVILSLVSVAPLNQKNLKRSITDELFDDLEDGFQYHCARQNKCDAFITINLRDFRNADMTEMDILSPLEFVDKYL